MENIPKEILKQLEEVSQNIFDLNFSWKKYKKILKYFKSIIKKEYNFYYIDNVY
jgi:hypothetical protein